MDKFDQIEPEEVKALPPPRDPAPDPDPEPEPLDEKKMFDRMVKLLNMLASENENERNVAARKIGDLSRIMQMPVFDALKKLIGVPAPSLAAHAPEPDSAAAEAYTASGVPRNKVKPKEPRHNLDRLAAAYASAKESGLVIEEMDEARVEWLLGYEFDWQLHSRELRTVRQLTKKLLMEDAEPLV